MKCIDIRELELFLKGQLNTDRLLAVDEHIMTCADCKATINSIAARNNACNNLGAQLLGVADCPEYEKICAFIDGKLSGDELNAFNAHINTCELCSADIEKIHELRSHAAIRSKVTVKPGMTINRQQSWFKWKPALAAVSITAAVMVVAFSMSRHSVMSPGQTVQTAYKPAAPIEAPNQDHSPKMAVNTVQPKSLNSNQNSESSEVAQIPDKSGTNIGAKSAKTSPATNKIILKDGNYRVIEKENKLMLAKANGTSVRTALEARIAASIDEKIRTGKIKHAEPVMVAMNTSMRGSDAYKPSPVAPKPKSPNGKVIMSDKPTFTWSEVDLADAYRLIVTNTDGSIVFDRITSNTSLAMDKSLTRGKTYTWLVGVKFGESQSWANSAAAKFSVVSSDGYNTIQQVKQQLPGSHLALGAAYETFGLSDEATREYNALKQANHNSKAARELLR